MAIDPRLRHGLLASENEQVKAGGQILDHFEPCDDRHRECKDTCWALLFLGTAAIVAACAASKLPGPGGEGQAPPSLDASALLFDAGAAAVVAVGGALLFLAAADRATEHAIWWALLAFPSLFVIGGLLLGGTYGIVVVVIGVCLAGCVHCCCKDLIPLTALLIQTSIGAMRAHRGVIAVPLLGAVLSMAWCLLCVSAGLDLYAPRHGDAAGGGIFLGSLTLLWGSMVAVNASHVACSGVVGRWYFGRDQDAPVSRSTKAAFVYSFGSVCFASFVLASVRALKILMKAVMRDAQGEGNMVLCVIACCLALIIQCIGDMVEWLNNLAFVQCAVRGLSFIDAARATYALCIFANCDKICANSLVGAVVCFGAVLFSVLGAVAVWLLGGESVIAAAVVSYVVARAMLQPLESGATTLIVCWAENPSTLARRKPELASAFAQRGHDWHGGGGEAVFAMQPQPGGVEGPAASPMVEITSRPPRQIAVSVPQGVMPGQRVQVHTPEGRTLEVEVPEGCGPGSQFLADY